MICKITVKPSNEEIKVSKGTLLSEALQKISLFETFCGGNGICQKCKVMAEGKMSPKTEKEKCLPKGYRLACQTKILGDVTVYETDCDSSVRVLTDIKLRKTEIPQNQTGYGIAFDIGTTTVAAYLIRLKSGTICEVSSASNPQKFCGGDVISRIDWQMKHPEEKDTLRKYIIQICNRLINNFHINHNDIKKISVAGNTCMHHIFMGLDTKSLGYAPYVPKMTDKWETDAKNLGIDLNAKILVFPNIAGFVGGDTVAMILSLMPNDTGETVLAIDIGTNGECALRHKGKLYVCSAAAGPAFEGGNISRGMRGETGAIDRVWSEKGDIRFHVIGDTEPKGFCGSGLLDYISFLLKEKYINKNGKIIKDPPNIKDISLSQKDIRNFQLAKGSVAAAVKTLLYYAEITEKDLNKVYLAGAFGNYLNPKSAIDIGLLPDCEIISAGNASGAGACLALLNEEEWENAEKISQEAIHIKLEENEKYTDFLMESVLFS